MITRDTAVSAGLRGPDLCLALGRNFKNKKDIYENEILVAELEKICNFMKIYTKHESEAKTLFIRHFVSNLSGFIYECLSRLFHRDWYWVCIRTI